MKKIKLQYLILFFCLLIIGQIIWIGLRLNKLKQNSFESVQPRTEEQIKEELKKVSEPEIEMGFNEGE